VQTQTVTVGYYTGDGTAVAPGDYAYTSGTLTFAPGETQKTISVAVVGDTNLEGDEYFYLYMQNPVNADTSGSFAPMTIVNDDVRGGCWVEGRCSPPSCSLSRGALATAWLLQAGSDAHQHWVGGGAHPPHALSPSPPATVCVRFHQRGHFA
jgi:hypothetical protein